MRLHTVFIRDRSRLAIPLFRAGKINFLSVIVSKMSLWNGFKWHLWFLTQWKFLFSEQWEFVFKGKCCLTVWYFLLLSFQLFLTIIYDTLSSLAGLPSLAVLDKKTQVLRLLRELGQWSIDLTKSSYFLKSNTVL